MRVWLEVNHSGDLVRPRQADLQIWPLFPEDDGLLRHGESDPVTVLYRQSVEGRRSENPRLGRTDDHEVVDGPRIGQQAHTIDVALIRHHQIENHQVFDRNVGGRFRGQVRTDNDRWQNFPVCTGIDSHSIVISLSAACCLDFDRLVEDMRRRRSR